MGRREAGIREMEGQEELCQLRWRARAAIMWYDSSDLLP